MQAALKAKQYAAEEEARKKREGEKAKREAERRRKGLVKVKNADSALPSKRPSRQKRGGMREEGEARPTMTCVRFSRSGFL